MARQYWQHKTSGDVYAVETDADGRVIGSYGPMFYSEITQDVAGWDLDLEPMDNDWLNDHEDDFRLHEPTA